MTTKIESILDDRLNRCTKCTEPGNEELRKLYYTVQYTPFIGVCGIKKTEIQERWDNRYRNMCRNIEKEAEKTYRTLRSILHRFAKIKNDELIYKEIKADYKSGELKRKHIQKYKDDIAKIQATIDMLKDIPDRDFFIHTCKNHNVFAYGNPVEAMAVLEEVCVQQTGQSLDTMIKDAAHD